MGGEKNCWPIPHPAWSSRRRFGLSPAGRQPRAGISRRQTQGPLRRLPIRHKDMFMSNEQSSAPLALATLLAGLEAAGEETRLRILCLLEAAELTVSELVAILGQ